MRAMAFDLAATLKTLLDGGWRIWAGLTFACLVLLLYLDPVLAVGLKSAHVFIGLVVFGSLLGSSALPDFRALRAAKVARLALADEKAAAEAEMRRIEDEKVGNLRRRLSRCTSDELRFLRRFLATGHVQATDDAAFGLAMDLVRRGLISHQNVHEAGFLMEEWQLRLFEDHEELRGTLEPQAPVLVAAEEPKAIPEKTGK
jgi:hypothetical protein